MRTRVAEQIGVSFALTLFVVSLAAGILADVAGATVLLRSVVVLFVAYPVGCLIGKAAAFTLNEHLTLIHAGRSSPDRAVEADDVDRTAPVDEAGAS